ncbi:hypothetical protein Sjap_005115 [Stephania japonica]|uniref:Uncharacterized protein n=1 Tax=Stephania japonica TaxID=461633 RepID=A0AAP0K3G8_9MAGN
MEQEVTNVFYNMTDFFLIGSTAPQVDYVWRIILMLRALPAALTYYWRRKMPETARYTALVAKDAKQVAADMSKVLQVQIVVEQEKVERLGQDRKRSFGLFSKEFVMRHGLHLLGTAATWFLVDVAYYSQNLFQKDIFSSIGWIPPAQSMNALEEVYRIARAQSLIASHLSRFSLLTLLVRESKGRSLEEISGENDGGFLRRSP